MRNVSLPNSRPAQEFELRNENWEICAEKSVASAPDFVTRNRKPAVLRILPGACFGICSPEFEMCVWNLRLEFFAKINELTISNNLAVARNKFR